MKIRYELDILDRKEGWDIIDVERFGKSATPNIQSLYRLESMEMEGIAE